MCVYIYIYIYKYIYIYIYTSTAALYAPPQRLCWRRHACRETPSAPWPPIASRHLRYAQVCPRLLDALPHFFRVFFIPVPRNLKPLDVFVK